VQSPLQPPARVVRHQARVGERPRRLAPRSAGSSKCKATGSTL
jgi:hypothetical protein